MVKKGLKNNFQKKYCKFKLSCGILILVAKKDNLLLRPVGQGVKTPPFHGGNRGSNPLRVISSPPHEIYIPDEKSSKSLLLKTRMKHGTSGEFYSKSH